MANDILFQPISIGTLKLRNRIIMTPMSTRFLGSGGAVTDELLEHYARRARGGVAMVTVELADAHPLLLHLKQSLWIHNDAMIPRLRNITEIIHKNGAAASIQIGAYFRPGVTGLAHHTSSLGSPEATPNSIELNREELDWISDILAQAARRAKEAGFDAVELHGVHGSIIEEFLSPYWNKRTDEYGGSRENRFRFPLEVLDKVKKAVGADFPVLYRICATEFHPEGSTVEDAVAFAQAAEAHGLDAVHLSGGIGHIDHLAISASYEPRAMLVEASRQIKAGVSIPVIVANALTPQQAVEALASEAADIIGLGRPLLVDPDWPIKMQNGQERSIRPCVRCNQGCMGGLRDTSLPHILCLANPQMGRLYQERPAIAEISKRIVVVGGGPAGCEAALVAAQRGHSVTLLEDKERLGGQFRIAAIPPGKEDFKALSDYFEYALPEEGVDIRTSIRADAETIKALSPDLIVLATGSVPAIPPIPGIDMPHVYSAIDILTEKAKPADGPVVVLGAGATGLETAHFLAERGYSVTVADMLTIPGRDIVASVGVRERLLGLLKDGGVTLKLGVRICAISDEGVAVNCRPLLGGGTSEILPAATVVVALGQRPRREIFSAVEELGVPVVYLGDCDKAGNALSAMHQAYEQALTF